MYLIEKDVEAKIVEMLKTAVAGLSGVEIVGSWQSSNVGEVKGEEKSTDRIRLAVATGAPEFSSWLASDADIPVAIAVTVRQDTAPTAAEVATVMEPVSGMLLNLQLESNADVSAALSVEKFNVDGVRLDPGDPPVYDAQRKRWRISRSFTVRGTVK